MPDRIKYGLLGTVSVLITLLMMSGFGTVIADVFLTAIGFIGGAIVGKRKNSWIWALAGG